MSLKNNPFYILKLSCSANRHEIVVASEEMGLVLGSSVCLKAQNTLINLNRRIGAELDWFIDVDEDILKGIRDRIENDKLISTDKLMSLSKLNATLFNFDLTKASNPHELGYAILDIDEQYSALDNKEIAEAINQNRAKGNLATVQEQDVYSELNKKRYVIRQSITEKLDTLGDIPYIELITMLAERCIADKDYDDGVVLSDVIDQYEVRMQSTLENGAEAIMAHIDRIKRLANDEAISDNINALIKRIQKWDLIAQPLQLKSQASGMPHQISESLGIELRNLALYLHNEKGKTIEALILVDSMQDVFAELGNMRDLFRSDSEVLNDLLQGEKNTKAVLDELESLTKASESLKNYATSSSVDSFINLVKGLDIKLKDLDLDLETRTKVRESLCLLARETAIELHNSKHQTRYALDIARALVIEFSDLASLSSKLNEDSLALSRQLLLSNRTPTYSSRPYSSPSSSKSSNSGCLVWIAIAAVIIVIISIVIDISGSSSKSSNSSSSSTYSQNNFGNTKPEKKEESKFTKNSTSGDAVYADIVSIFPEIGIYTQGSSNYSHFVCKCKTSFGSTVWVYMTCSEYKSNFDSSASTSIYNQYADEKTFSSKRVHGTAKRAESIMSGLSSDTGIMLIYFCSVD